ncbi:Poly(ADP-ribose) polymerase [Thecamonas trahens ATCC 50062]|uniref:Poly [ADP-ribose] polymerase n=1 Tax=Thecamonas trahens ATCC 50062 TaxID=461836 RepID=A0A0L0DUE2_THETB|nr:Poly(ADP-ribose) polymerase [Thecamonas trahens ATCC 50062]KNC55063.1 Poly(ADP-ribose) polymerase [Thecamonas trahens ATCC 50062]|eukprot:XP_013753367.1 Poly(ADP-ribose) polymerase [Thecamonas trahens ATCC 50062]
MWNLDHIEYVLGLRGARSSHIRETVGMVKRVADTARGFAPEPGCDYSLADLFDRFAPAIQKRAKSSIGTSQAPTRRMDSTDKVMDAPADALVIRDTLQMTNIKSNNNKFYILELLLLDDGAAAVVTNYGRTGASGGGVRKEARLYPTVDAGFRGYASIFVAKVSKGYRPVTLAAANLGSPAADARAEAEARLVAAGPVRGGAAVARPAGALPDADSAVLGFVDVIAREALDRLLQVIPGKITVRGIETPLGVLSAQQVDDARAALEAIRAALEADASHNELATASSAFYSIVPHDLARSSLLEHIIDTPAKLRAKVELVQLMDDVVNVGAGAGSGPSGPAALIADSPQVKYAALGADLRAVPDDSPEYVQIAKHVHITDLKDFGITIKGLYAVTRPGEPSDDDLAGLVGPRGVRRLFHGSRASNWMGLLSRGILLPQTIVSRGGQRTDAGALGAGVYFGSDASTAAQYCTPVAAAGRPPRRFMAIAAVAVGNAARLTEPNPLLLSPPHGADSVHGSRIDEHGEPTSFTDDEFVVYAPGRYALRYIVEFEANVVAMQTLKPSPKGFVSIKSAPAPAPSPALISLPADAPSGDASRDGPHFPPRVYAHGSRDSLGFEPAMIPRPNGLVIGSMPQPPPLSRDALIVSELLRRCRQLYRGGTISRECYSEFKDAILSDGPLSQVWTRVLTVLGPTSHPVLGLQPAVATTILEFAVTAM